MAEIQPLTVRFPATVLADLDQVLATLNAESLGTISRNAAIVQAVREWTDRNRKGSAIVSKTTLRDILNEFGADEYVADDGSRDYNLTDLANELDDEDLSREAVAVEGNSGAYLVRAVGPDGYQGQVLYTLHPIRTWYVWGTGPTSSPLLRSAEASDAATQTALAHGFDGEAGDWTDSWAVEVRATEADIDAATRFDPAVIGYEEAPR